MMWAANHWARSSVIGCVRFSIAPPKPKQTVIRYRNHPVPPSVTKMLCDARRGHNGYTLP